MGTSRKVAQSPMGMLSVQSSTVSPAFPRVEGVWERRAGNIPGCITPPSPLALSPAVTSPARPATMEPTVLKPAAATTVPATR